MKLALPLPAQGVPRQAASDIELQRHRPLPLASIYLAPLAVRTELLRMSSNMATEVDELTRSTREASESRLAIKLPCSPGSRNRTLTLSLEPVGEHPGLSRIWSLRLSDCLLMSIDNADLLITQRGSWIPPPSKRTSTIYLRYTGSSPPTRTRTIRCRVISSALERFRLLLSRPC